jgi:hypothetical protein
MRLPLKNIAFLKEQVHLIAPDASVFLFGSRTDEKARGGDVDLLIVASVKITARQTRQIRCRYYKEFGWQKLDIVCTVKGEQSPFLQLISNQAIPL